MTLELNETLIEGEPCTLSLMARDGQLTCLTGGNRQRQTRWLYAMLGMVPVKSGYVCIDGEPLTARSAATFRQLMAYAPAQLGALGGVVSYAPPSVQDVFSLHANRDLPISNGILGEEVRRTGADATDERAQLLAVAVLLGRPILLADNPPVLSASYLQHQAAQGRIVIACTNEREVLAVADQVIELYER